MLSGVVLCFSIFKNNNYLAIIAGILYQMSNIYHGNGRRSPLNPLKNNVISHFFLSLPRKIHNNSYGRLSSTVLGRQRFFFEPLFAGSNCNSRFGVRLRKGGLPKQRNMRKFLYCKEGFAETSAWQPDCWISVVTPTEEDIRYLTEELEVPQAFLSDIEDVDERPRMETEDGWTLMILRIPYRDTQNDIPYITVPLGMIMKDHHFVTVCHYETDMLPDFLLYTRRKNLKVEGNWDLLFRLFLSSSVWYLKYLKQLNNQSRAVEKELERSIQNAELQRLLKIEKSLVFFITSLRGNDNLLIKLKNLKNQRQFFDPDLVEDVEIELRQAQDTSRIYSDILSGTMDTYASVISNNLNVIMKRMTAISLILMVPTLIASLYGMNVHNGLEDSRYGLFVIAVISVGFAVMSFLLFRKRRWL